ncbi:alpha/beta hydrolase [Pyrofollis japonicus]|uniref:alpha/beta hydrolase n=1 Tax=Pyrofollis japonicus TaxID=3060460 RepID=UPI00295ACFB5|nr:alpha/beta fold hydrolase [Pyrofollis japonicus]BEP18557.1 alpha/beta hydrolase [Pyrofollis japonicus]
MQPIVAIASLVLTFIGFLTALAYVSARRLLKPPRKVEEWSPRDLGFDFKDVEVVTRDNVKLRGWFIDVGGKKTVIAIHGYTSSKWDTGYMKPVLELLAKSGYNVAMFDFRAHGSSEGEYTTLGYTEIEDYKEIISWIKNQFPDKAVKIGVIGYSMGGAVSIMLNALEDRVDATIADSPYINIVSSGKRWIKRIKGPMRYLLLLSYPLIIRFASRIAKVDVDALNMMNYADKLKKPLLVIAGKEDDLVSLDEVKKFYEKAVSSGKHVELWITDARHVESILKYPQEYREKVISFLERWL